MVYKVYWCNYMLNRVQQLNLDNKIRTVAKQIFDILLSEEKINFEFVQQNQVKFIGMEERLIKNQIQCEALQTKFDSKFATASILISEMNQFKQSAESNIIALTNSIYHIENSIQLTSDSTKEKEGSFTQINAMMKRLENEMVSIRSDVKLNREFVVKKLNEDMHRLNQEVSQMRILSNSIGIEFQKTKTEMEYKQGELEECLTYIRKYQLNDKEVQSKLKLVIDELELRPLQVQLFETKRAIDNRITAENSLIKQGLRSINQRFKVFESDHSVFSQRMDSFQLKTQEKAIRDDKRLEQLQQSVNEIQKVTESVQKRVNEDGDNIKNILKELNHFYTNIDGIRNRLEDIGEIEERIGEVETKLDETTSNLEKIGRKGQGGLEVESNSAKQNGIEDLKSEQMEKTSRVGSKERHPTEQLPPLEPRKRRTSRISKFKLSEEIELQNDKQSQRNKKLDEQIAKIKAWTEQQSILNQQLQLQIQTQADSQSQSLQQLSTSLLKLGKKVTNLQSKFQVVEKATEQISQKFNSIQTIVNKVDNVGDILADIDTKVKHFEALSLSMTTRTQEINNMLVKTRSDFTIKIQTLNKQIAKLYSEQRGIEKNVSTLASSLPIVMEIIFILLAKNLNEIHFKRALYLFKFISPVDGMIYSLDDKITEPHTLTYRGETLPTIALLSKSLQFLIEHIDHVRTMNKGIYAPGKEIYKSIYPKTEVLLSQTTQTRIRSVSKNRRSIL